MRLTEDFANDLRPKIFLEAIAGWRDRDDKWAFPRSVLDRIAQENRAEVRVYGLHDNVGQFRRHFSYMLETYGGMKVTEYPGWAWDIFDRYDKDTFSPEMLIDLALEGCISCLGNFPDACCVTNRLSRGRLSLMTFYNAALRIHTSQLFWTENEDASPGRKFVAARQFDLR